MHTTTLKWHQFGKDLESEHLIHPSASEQDPINLNYSLISICLTCFSKPPRMEEPHFSKQSASLLSLLENSPKASCKSPAKVLPIQSLFLMICVIWLGVPWACLLFPSSLPSLIFQVSYCCRLWLPFAMLGFIFKNAHEKTAALHPPSMRGGKQMSSISFSVANAVMSFQENPPDTSVIILNERA